MKLLLCLALFFLFTQDNFSQSVKYVKGKAHARFERKRVAITKGDLLRYGSQIQTARDSVVIISFPSGSQLKVDPNSKLKLEPPKEVRGEKQHLIELMRGGLSMFFKKRNTGEHLIIKKKSIALAVRGTTFFMGQDGRDLFASVKEGKVALVETASLDYEDVNGGQSILIEKGKTLTKPTAFEWSKALNWDFDGGGLSSGFFAKDLKKARRNEVSKRIEKLRKRVRKKLIGPFESRLKGLKSAKKALKRKKQKIRQRVQRKIKDPLNIQRRTRNQKRKINKRVNRKKLIKGLGL